MNVREGMRRLGILMGACGGILGGCLAYNDARTTWDNHMAHKKFEALMSSPTMRKFAKAISTVPSDSSQSERVKSPPQSQDWFERNAPPPRSKFGGVPLFDGTPVKDGSDVEEWLAKRRQPVTVVQSEIPVSANPEGIKQVTLDEVGAISSVELSTGESVQRVDRQPIKAYLIPLLYPVVGFLFPWGGIRLLTWVGSGFVEPRR